MKQSRNYPRLLTHVLQAVADLKEPNGSSVKNILAQVQTAINISNIRPKPRNVVMQVRRAIRHGIENGVLKQRAGKVFLTIGTRNSNTHSKPNAKTAKRRSQRLKQNKNMRTNQCSDCSLNEPLRNAVKSFRRKKEDDEPVDKSRRRKKAKRSRRKGKRHHRRARENVPDENEKDKDKEDNDSLKRTPSKEKEENNREECPENNEAANEEQNHVSCDNPDCLCNLKQEPNDIDDNYNNYL